MLKVFTSLLFMCIFVSVGLTQSLQNQVIAGAGGSFISINTLDFTLGEPIIDLYKQTSTLHQGFHQVIVSKLTTSVNDAEEEVQIKIYPNPTSQWLNVSSSTDLTDATVIINPIDGQIIYRKKIIGSFHSIDIKDLSVGTYILQLIKGGQVTSYKFIKTNF